MAAFKYSKFFPGPTWIPEAIGFCAVVASLFLGVFVAAAWMGQFSRPGSRLRTLAVLPVGILVLLSTLYLIIAAAVAVLQSH